ncbi:MAG: hypothetical protein KTR20_10875 [Cellvibrionaceae bacterium]|nr:hypothetical protein [Cellvibrionaceae bacterium]
MKHFIFSGRAVYKLRLLSQAVLKKTGVRHRLSQQRSVMELLRYSSTTPDGVIFDHFCEFTQELDEQQRKYLEGRGLLLPSVIVDKINAYSEQRSMM